MNGGPHWGSLIDLASKAASHLQRDPPEIFPVSQNSLRWIPTLIIEVQIAIHRTIESSIRYSFLFNFINEILLDVISFKWRT